MRPSATQSRRAHHAVHPHPLLRFLKAYHHVEKTRSSLKNDLRDEIEEAAQRRAFEDRARGGGTGEIAAGAVLGGLLGGPFGE